MKRGWAYDGMSQVIPGSLALYFINEETKELTLAKIRRREQRGDVAKAFGNPALGASGFSRSSAKNELRAGSYRLVLLQVDGEVGAIGCAGEPHRIIAN